MCVQSYAHSVSQSKTVKEREKKACVYKKIYKLLCVYSLSLSKKRERSKIYSILALEY